MKQAALIGSPLRRRHSAVMHNAAFRAFGVEATYRLLELPPDDLDGFFENARSEDWLGFQVTAPYKQEAARRCDEVEPVAGRLGAVNSVLRRPDGSLLGFNTDAPGFARSAAEDLDFTFGGSTVLVAGAGGAARAVAAAAIEEGASRVVVGARRIGSARQLVEDLSDPRLEAVELGPDFDRWLADADLAVNATTVGMTSAGLPFDPGDMASKGGVVFDLVYVPPATELLQACRESGIRAVNGLGMLVAQAEIAFERWTGVTGAGPVMRQALEDLSPGTER